MPRPPASVDPYQWTLDLPPGKHCSVGWSSNMIYNPDGSHLYGGRPNEDKFYTCSSQDNRIQVYLVLDGHDGVRACEFAQKHLPSVLLRCDINERDDHTIISALKNAFVRTEREFFIRVDPQITRKLTLQIEINQKARNSAEAQMLFPGQVQEIMRLDDQIKGGTTAVVAVVINNKLYVANCGDSRAVLCSEDAAGRLKVQQISDDHNTQNDGELQRLAECGLDPHTLRKNKRLGTQQNTRSIGDYSIKGGYTDVDVIRHATREPGTAEPYLAAPFDLSTFQGFLILMTDGLYEAYESWTCRPIKVNQDIGHLIAQEIREATSFDVVAQNVVEKVKHVFQKSCINESRVGRLDDITLIVRNFGYHSSYPSSLVQPTTSYVELAQKQSVFVPFPNNAQPQMSSGSGGAFPPQVVYGSGQMIPEAIDTPANTQPTSYLNQTNDPAYQSRTLHDHYSSGPSNNSQYPSPHPTSLQAPGSVVQPPQTDRQQSYPVTSQRYGGSHVDHYDPRKTWTSPQLPTNADDVLPTDYPNSPRTPAYMNVSPVPKRKSDSNLPDQVEALTLNDTPVEARTLFPKSVESETTSTNPDPLHTAMKSSPSDKQQRPSVSNVTVPGPSLNSDAENMELYGWTGNEEEPQTLADQQPDTLINDISNKEDQRYDTLKSETPRGRRDDNFSEDNSPPKKSDQEEENEEEGTMIVDINGDIGDVSEGSENEEEDTDGSVKAYVKFPPNFPQDLSWDDVQV